jgi:hypothetical protein
MRRRGGWLFLISRSATIVTLAVNDTESLRLKGRRSLTMNNQCTRHACILVERAGRDLHDTGWIRLASWLEKRGVDQVRISV